MGATLGLFGRLVSLNQQVGSVLKGFNMYKNKLYLQPFEHVEGTTCNCMVCMSAKAEYTLEFAEYVESVPQIISICDKCYVNDDYEFIYDSWECNTTGIFNP